MICLGACSLGLGISLFPRRKAEPARCSLLAALLAPQRLFRTGGGRGAPRVLPASFSPLAVVGEGVEEDGRPFYTSPLSCQADMAPVSTPHFALLALSGPIDLKILNLLLMDFLV